MPRLLLVDDNPSIHRIAESLLAPTDVELVCVASAAEALDRLGRGERFDVALVDTAMPGMDGWTLLGRLRAMEETARMPIALMAGVLDPVDPAKLAKAPIQGFLKKPIELRELGDRVKALLATPVQSQPSPFSTVPATPAQDLAQKPEVTLPEYRPEPEAADAESLAFDEDFLVEEEDLLVLNAEDLWPEEPVQPAAEPAPVDASPEPAPVLANSDVQLELEELDLDSLQDLTDEPLSALELPSTLEPAADLSAQVPPADLLTLESVGDLYLEPDAALEPGLMHVEMDEEPILTMSGLEALDAFPTDFDMPLPPAQEPAVEPEGGLTEIPVAASLAGAGVALGAAALVAQDASPESHGIPAPTPEAALLSGAVPAAVGQVPAASGQAVPPEQTQVLVQALLADPVLVDALVKAVVARMGDQVIREIAWEVMPDLAGRLQR